jgi:hypothetical protein
MDAHPRDNIALRSIKWCAEERGRLITQRDALRDGRLSIRENRGGRWVDLTIEGLALAMRNVAELDAMLAHFEVQEPHILPNS